jgi:hypothetical protein
MQVGFNNRKIFMGYFSSPADAARAYDKKVVQLHGALGEQSGGSGTVGFYNFLRSVCIIRFALAFFDCATARAFEHQVVQLHGALGECGSGTNVCLSLFGLQQHYHVCTVLLIGCELRALMTRRWCSCTARWVSCGSGGSCKWFVCVHNHFCIGLPDCATARAFDEKVVQLHGALGELRQQLSSFCLYVTVCIITSALACLIAQLQEHLMIKLCSCTAH